MIASTPRATVVSWSSSLSWVELRRPRSMCGAISPGPSTKWCQSPAPNQIEAAGKTGSASSSNNQPT
jgi:hypothetical protein